MADLPASKFLTIEQTAVRTEIDEAHPAMKKRIRTPTRAPVPVASVKNERGMNEMSVRIAATRNDTVFESLSVASPPIIPEYAPRYTAA